MLQNQNKNLMKEKFKIIWKKNKVTIIIIIILFGFLKNYDSIKEYIINLFQNEKNTFHVDSYYNLKYIKNQILKFKKIRFLELFINFF